MDVANNKSIRALIFLLKKNNYVIYEKPYQLNIIGVRSKSITPNKFDDKLYVFYKNDKGQWEGKWFTVTTDPGTYWLKNPMNKQGTAILKEGQYINAYKIGLHKGQYEALVQQKPVTVLRDYDRNALLDFRNGKEETGNFGINIHRANSTGTTKTIDKNSAGCQVFEDADDFKKFMAMAEKQRSLYGNNFTYTLFDERAYNRSMMRRTLYVVLALATLSVAWVGYRTYMKKPIIPKL